MEAVLEKLEDAFKLKGEIWKLEVLCVQTAANLKALQTTFSKKNGGKSLAYYLEEKIKATKVKDRDVIVEFVKRLLADPNEARDTDKGVDRTKALSDAALLEAVTEDTYVDVYLDVFLGKGGSMSFVQVKATDEATEEYDVLEGIEENFEHGVFRKLFLKYIEFALK